MRVALGVFVAILLLATGVAGFGAAAMQLRSLRDAVAEAIPKAVSAAMPTAKRTPRNASIEVYRGLGTWVDIWDDSAWRDPERAVDDMSKHGVKTLYIETANYVSKGAFVHPEKLKQFITEAHKHGIYVVAWYLPNMKSRSVDYERITAAIDFTTDSGERFDGFALDIESTSIKSDAVRNRSLVALSKKIRDYVGPDYALGAIIPSPVGLSREHSMWPGFPYETCAEYYDVILPMGYYTYHGKGADAARADTLGNLHILRGKPGCADIPVHLIGGEAEHSSNAETEAFVRASLEGKVIGGSLYGWPGTSSREWKSLSAFR
jgi:hypothetical protein